MHTTSIWAALAFLEASWVNTRTWPSLLPQTTSPLLSAATDHTEIAGSVMDWTHTPPAHKHRATAQLTFPNPDSAVFSAGYEAVGGPGEDSHRVDEGGMAEKLLHEVSLVAPHLDHTDF